MDILAICIRYIIAYTLFFSALYAAWQCARAWNLRPILIYLPTHVFLILLGGIGYLAILRFDEALLYAVALTSGLLFINHFTDAELGKFRSNPVDTSYVRYRKLWLVITVPLVLVLASSNVAYAIYTRYATQVSSSSAVSTEVQSLSAEPEVITKELTQVASGLTAIIPIISFTHYQLTLLLQDQATKNNLGYIAIVKNNGTVVARSNSDTWYGDILTSTESAKGVTYDSALNPVAQSTFPLHMEGQDFTLVGGIYIDQDYLHHDIKNNSSLFIANSTGVLGYASASQDIQRLIMSSEFKTIYLHTQQQKLSPFSITSNLITYLITCRSISLTVCTVATLPILPTSFKL